MTYKEYVQRNFKKDIDKDTLTDKQKRFFRIAYEEDLLLVSEFTVKSIKKRISQRGNSMYVLDLFEPEGVVEVRYYLLDCRVKDFFQCNHLNHLSLIHSITFLICSAILLITGTQTEFPTCLYALRIGVPGANL